MHAVFYLFFLLNVIIVALSMFGQSKACLSFGTVSWWLWSLFFPLNTHALDECFQSCDVSLHSFKKHFLYHWPFLSDWTGVWKQQSCFLFWFFALYKCNKWNFALMKAIYHSVCWPGRAWAEINLQTHLCFECLHSDRLLDSLIDWFIDLFSHSFNYIPIYLYIDYFVSFYF